MAPSPSVEPLATLLRARFGLAFTPRRARELEVKLERLLRRTGLSADAYLVELARRPDDDALVAELVAEVTINETRCFRDPRQLEALAAAAFPELARSAGPIRAWSAGCATGEEAWTLALLLEHAPALAGRPLEVLGTDLVGARVEAARTGEYGPRALEGVPPELRRSWFAPVAPDRERIDAARLRCRVRFATHNLMRDPPPAGPFALVVCRNVLIYYEDPADQLALVGALLDALAPDGWLVLGHAERVPDALAGRLEPVLQGGATVYRRARATPRLPELTPRAAPAPARTRPGPVVSAARPAQALAAPPPPAPAPLDLAEAVARADAGDLAGAVALLEAALARDPHAVSARLLLGALAERGGDLRGARRWLEQASYLAPTRPDVHLQAAALYDRLGLPVEAESARRAALAAETARVARVRPA